MFRLASISVFGNECWFVMKFIFIFQISVKTSDMDGNKDNVPLRTSTPISDAELWAIVESDGRAQPPDSQPVVVGSSPAEIVVVKEVLPRTGIARPRRKIPGPAGRLGCDAEEQDVSDEAVLARKVFSSRAWTAATSWLNNVDYPGILDLNIAWILKHTTMGPSKRVPLLLAVITHIKKFPREEDWDVELRDKSGNMRGTLRAITVEDYEEEIRPGTIVIVKDSTALMSIQHDNYLLIGEVNAIYVPEPKGYNARFLKRLDGAAAARKVRLALTDAGKSRSTRMREACARLREACQPKPPEVGEELSKDVEVPEDMTGSQKSDKTGSQKPDKTFSQKPGSQEPNSAGMAEEVSMAEESAMSKVGDADARAEHADEKEGGGRPQKKQKLKEDIGDEDEENCRCQ